MQRPKVLLLSLLIVYQAFFVIVKADVVEVFSGIESGRFIEGVNLTDNLLSASVGVEWSGDSGAFASLLCFIGENDFNNSIQRGCDGSLGFFVPINNNHAATFTVSQHDYSSPVLSGWQYTDISASWHLGKENTLKLRVSDSLLGQGFSSVTTSFHASRPIIDQWWVNFEAGLISLQSSAPINTLEYGLLGVNYSRGRWSTQLAVLTSSSDYQHFVNLDIGQPELSLSFRYQNY